MNIIKAAGTDYLIGLNWSRISPDNVKSEIDLTIKEFDADIGLIRKTEDRVQLGLINDKQAVGKYSAAAMLADTTDNIVFVSKLSEGKFWIVGILGGEVLSGSDVISGEETSAALIDEFATLTSMDGEPLNVVFDDNAVGEIDVENIDGTATFEQLIDGKKPSPNTKIKKLKSKAKQIIILASIIGVIGLGFAGMQYKAALDKEAEMAALDAMLAAKKNGAKVPVYSNDVIEKQARTEENMWLNTTLQHTLGDRYLDESINFLKSLGSNNVAGWQLADYNILYSVGIPATINTEWKRLNGNVSSIKEGTTMDNYSFSGDGKILKATKLLSPTDIVEENIYEERIKKSPSRDIQMDFLDKYDIRYAYGSTEKRMREEVVANSTKVDDRDRRLPYKTTMIDLDGTGFNTLSLIQEEIKKDGIFKSLKIEEINITPAKKISWSIKGELYEN